MPVHLIKQPLHRVRGARRSRTIIGWQERCALSTELVDHFGGRARQVFPRPFPQAACPLHKSLFALRLIDLPSFVENLVPQLSPAATSNFKD
jgi:hypothetical protein